MSTCIRPLPRLLAGLALSLTLTLTLSGCGALIVTNTVVGAGSLVVGGAVGAVKLTGKTAGAVVGLAREEEDQAE
ncbi:MAG: hypothetical protein ABJN75_09105 [Hoeflea sp.]|uniref:hypothetical protein n=1 Tax=Hoeflea sp. TaxID=1940281 RepID=UPI003298A090